MLEEHFSERGKEVIERGNVDDDCGCVRERGNVEREHAKRLIQRLAREEAAREEAAREARLCLDGLWLQLPLPLQIETPTGTKEGVLLAGEALTTARSCRSGVLWLRRRELRSSPQARLQR